MARVGSSFMMEGLDYVPTTELTKYANATHKWLFNDSKERYKSNCTNPEIAKHISTNDVTYRLNTYGFRSREIVEDKNCIVALGCSHTFGLGLGEGVQKLFYLPEAHNDFIFSVVAEELGAIGVILLALVSSYLVLQLFLLARQNAARKAHFAAVVAYFTGLVLGLQFLVNLGVNAGVLPTKGLTLPFVSYGGNSLVISCALVALTLRASMEKVDASG